MDRRDGVYVDGGWRPGQGRLEVRDKYTGEVVVELRSAGLADVDAALSGAERAAASPLSAPDRHDILVRAADLLIERRESVQDDYVTESGFTPADAAGEVERAAAVLRLSAQEALRIAGEQIPVEATRGSENRLAFTMRVPVGVVAAVAPFNAPLVTVAHKIGPALAAGNAVVLKPAEQTPLSAAALTDVLTDAGLPAGYLQVVNGLGDTVGQSLVSDPRVRFVTFTGSTAVGRSIRASCGLARTHLELGANSASIVAADADLDLVAQITLRSGFRKAGQVCTSIQRLLVDSSVEHELTERLAAKIEALRAGDPRARGTDVGPMIHEREAERAATWVSTSRGAGTRVIGGEREGAILQPTLVARPSHDSRLLVDEAFAPIVTLVPTSSFEEALNVINAGPYGLQAGVFTQDIDRAMYATKRLRVGGVIVNDSSSYHADAMPYGGVKDSGHGLEGPRYATRDMTDSRIVVMNLRSPRA